jgi:hypothetical protein
MIEDALAYARRGWHVFPLHHIINGRCTCGKAKCRSPGKHPRTRHGLKDATTEEPTVTAWWTKTPDANIGVPTGKASGFVVLDVDTQHGGEESLRQLEKEYKKLPDTPISLTGGGGQHLLFAYPDPPGQDVQNRVALREGLDVRADGGYIVAPPSNHISGRNYEWEVLYHPDTVTPPPLPDWLLLLIEMRELPSQAEGQDPLDAAIDTGVEEGQRNDMAARLSGRYFGRGLSAKEVETLLIGWNQRNRPPMPIAELVAVITSVAKRELLKSGVEEKPEETLKELSACLNIPFDKIERIEGSEPVYRFHACGHIAVMPAELLLNQHKWRGAIAASTRRVPRPIGSKARISWNQLVQKMFDVAVTIDPGDEATVRGELLSNVRAYLDRSTPKPVNESTGDFTDSRLEKDGVYISSSALREYLHGMQLRISPQKLAKLLAGEGFVSKHFAVPLKGGRRTSVMMWRVPDGL